MSDAKHGEIGGAALSEEVLASSKTLLNEHRNSGKTVGLQQYFTPPEVAEFVATVIGRHVPVIDPQAGNGSMLQGFYAANRFGLEIDADQVKRGDYEAIRGDAQRLVPMLRAIGARFPSVAMNPPFGLEWTDAVHKQKGHLNSTVLSFLWGIDLLERTGHGVLLCGTNRLNREVMTRPEADKSVYAILDIEDTLWPGDVDVLCSLAFFTHPSNARPTLKMRDGLRYRDSVVLDEIRNSGQHRRAVVQAQRDLCRTPAGGYTPEASYFLTKFEATRIEYERREAIRVNKRSRIKHDVSLKGKKLVVQPSAYAQLKLNDRGTLRGIQLLHHQSISYFGQNQRDWKNIQEAEDLDLITVEPTLRERVQRVIEESEVLSTPLFPVKDQMRLGWITDLEKIECIRTDSEQGFMAGESYDIQTYSQILENTEHRAKENKKGDVEVRKFTTERKLLVVSIRGNMGLRQFNESPENIKYILRHFDVPDPGDVATRFPDLVEENRRILKEIEAEIALNVETYYDEHPEEERKPFRFKAFQIDHMSRLLTKGRGPLAHEQGLGKTLMLMALAYATIKKGAENKALFISPQDLIPQWGRESKKYFGIEMEYIRSPAHARDVARRLDAGETGWFITHFEALCLVGRKAGPQHQLPAAPLDPSEALTERLRLFKRAKAIKKNNGIDPLTGNTHVPKTPAQEIDEMIRVDADLFVSTKHACPKCLSDTTQGWDGEVCRECSYTHRRLHVKSGYAALTSCFIDGVMCVDELSEMRGDTSLRSKSIRALARGKHKFGGTGTPISNYVNDAYWGLWWSLGNATPAFPYDYQGGKAKFERDFCVIEYLMGKAEDNKEHARQQRTVLPKVTNVSQFWRLTQPSVSRCRKEQTGEPLVKRTFHPIRVPLGVAQKKQIEFWLYNFEAYFTWKHPDHKLVQLDLVEKFAKALGQLHHLESAATLPTDDQAMYEWPHAKLELPPPSPWTPGTLKVLEVAIDHAKRGEKVLIGSDIIAPGKWISDRLTEKGVRSVHITEEKQGKTTTKNPRKRAGEISDFAAGDAQVLCTGIQAMKLGHNLDVASTVIVHGLPYSHMFMDQFLARVHRLTSKREVSVYVILPRDSIAERKWALLKDKGGAADLALDGELSAQEEKPVDWSKILRDMKERGISTTGDEVHEADVMAAWEEIEPIADAKPQKILVPTIRPSTETKPVVNKPTKPGLLEKLTEEEPAETVTTDTTEPTEAEETLRSKKKSWDDVEAKATVNKPRKSKAKEADPLSLSLF